MTDSLPATTDSVKMPVVGLEDVDYSSIRPPIIKIDHASATYEDTLTGETFPEMKVIILGLVKQRVMWDTELSGDDKPYPLCRSLDFKVGFPTDKFPWTQQSNFPTPAELDAAPPLPCAQCKFKEWDSNPTRNGPPWCTEQHTFLLMQEVSDDVWSPALITFQRSAIQNSNKYLSSFQRAQEPMFKYYTTLRLEAKKRGKNTYGVPTFMKGAETPSDLWGSYADTYVAIRKLVQSPRADENARDIDDDDEVVEATTVNIPTSKGAPKNSKKGTDEVIVVADSDDEEIPF